MLEIFDVPLTGCVFIFSLLDVELQKLYDSSKEHDSYKWKDKMRYVWNEDQVKAILDNMRGLQSAFDLMLTVLQTYVSRSSVHFRQDHKLIAKRSSTSSLISLLQEQKAVIERVKKNTRSFHESLSPQFDLKTDADRRELSEKSSFLDSNLGDEEFSFDEEIINTFAYRNAIKRLASKAKTARWNAKPDECYILDEPRIDSEKLPQTHSELRAKPIASSNHQCLTPTMNFMQPGLHGYTVTEDPQRQRTISVESPEIESQAAIASSTCMNGNSWDIGLLLIKFLYILIFINLVIGILYSHV